MKMFSQIKNLIDAAADYMAKANTIAELSQLSDHQLQDIGMQRHQLNAQLTEAWNDDKQPAPVVAVKTKPVPAPQKRQPESGFAQLLIGLYSNWNRTGYVV